MCLPGIWVLDGCGLEVAKDGRRRKWLTGETRESTDGLVCEHRPGQADGMRGMRPERGRRAKGCVVDRARRVWRMDIDSKSEKKRTMAMDEMEDELRKQGRTKHQEQAATTHGGRGKVR